MSVADKIYDKLKSAPPAMVAEVLDFVEFLEARAKQTVAPSETGSKVEWENFFGVWKDSPISGGDPVAFQRKLRDEWS